MSTTRRPLRAVVARVLLPAALGLGALSVPAAAVGAATSRSGAPGRLAGSCPTLATARQRVEQGLATRSADLSRLDAVVAGAASLTSSDRATLETDLSDEANGLAALDQAAATAATCPALAEDRRAMVVTFRVGSVLAPEVDLVVLADRLSSLVATLTAYEPALRSAVAGAGGPGGAEALLADYQDRVRVAAGDLSGLTATLLAQTPAGYPANRAVFTQALAAEKAARRQVRAATADGHRLLAGPAPATTTTSG